AVGSHAQARGRRPVPPRPQSDDQRGRADAVGRGALFRVAIRRALGCDVSARQSRIFRAPGRARARGEVRRRGPGVQGARAALDPADSSVDGRVAPAANSRGSPMGVKVEGLVPLIQVFDMPTSLRFYRDLLGFEIVAQSSPGDDFDWGWLRLDDADLM